VVTIWRWADWIEPVAPEARISLGEGSTPLIRSQVIGPQAGLQNLFFKLESTNPTGSFKDRFAAAAISHMRAAGRSRCLATSSGNTGSAVAAYAAAARLDCHIAVVETAPQGKLQQMMAYGANVFRIRGFGLDPALSVSTFQTLQRLGLQPDAALQISSYIYSAAGMTGVETISFELHAQQELPIEHVFCPAGGGGLCVAVARGFATLARVGERPQGPAVHCVQPEGNDTMAGPLRRGAAEAQEVTCTTRISGLQVPNINDGHLVVQECRPTGGTGHLVRDDRVWELQGQLARQEGIFTEPAGAVALAGALQAAQEGLVEASAPVVCLVTGSGFKDEEAVARMLGEADCPMIEENQLETVV